jgi:hypothetical protein
LEAAVAARGMPLRRLPVAILRTEVSVLFFARAVMAAFSIDILVYELSLASGNCVDPTEMH